VAEQLDGQSAGAPGTVQLGVAVLADLAVERGQRRVVAFGVLPDVQRGQVQPDGLGHPQHPGHRAVRDPAAEVPTQ
jgi:hypothetical protein